LKIDWIPAYAGMTDLDNFQKIVQLILSGIKASLY